MERHYVVYMLGTPTCTLYTTKVLTEEWCLTVLVYTLSVGTLSCWLPCCAHLCWLRVLNPGMLQFHPRLLFWVSVSPVVGWCSIIHPCCLIELRFLHLLLINVIVLICMIFVECIHKGSHVGQDVDPLQNALVAPESFFGLAAVIRQLEPMFKKWMLVHQELFNPLLTKPMFLSIPGCWPTLEIMDVGSL